MKVNFFNRSMLKFTLPVILGIVTARAVRAQSFVTVYNPITAQSVPELINSVVTAILGIVGALALMMFIYGGMIWMTSIGNTQRIEKGKETLKWATIGLMIIFASYAILRVIFEALTGNP